MIIAIQQPEHFPWIGFFNKMISIDEFIYLDNVQFKKRYFENRNKIRSGKAWEWLSVPVITRGLYTQKINEVMIDYTQNWQRKYLNKVRVNYGKSVFFEEIFGSIAEIIGKNYNKLLELNLKLIDFVRGYLEIKTPEVCASSISEGRGSDLILDLCLKRNAHIYLSGPDGRNYLDLEQFRKNNIKIEFHDYAHPIYRQIHEPFVSHMSALDLLFNYGNKAMDIIKFEP